MYTILELYDIVSNILFITTHFSQVAQKYCTAKLVIYSCWQKVSTVKSLIEVLNWCVGIDSLVKFRFLSFK